MSTQPIPNMRRIRPIDVGATREFVSKADLCLHCGALPTCTIRARQQRVWRLLAEKQCGQFQPVLTFQSLAGMEGRFNTFRMGGAWARRVVPGTVVALMDRSKTIVAHARVYKVDYGDKHAMAREHGASNHLILARGTRGLTVEEAMLKVLRNVFGKLIFEAQPKATVIYLERLHEGDDHTH